jgi:hypothetical protein
MPNIQNPISSAETNQNYTQDNAQPGTVDPVDICNTSLKDVYPKKEIEVSKGHQE